MHELIETKPAIDVQESEFRRLLGYPPDYEPDRLSRELSDQTRAWYAEHGRPWFYLREVSLTLTEKSFLLDGAEFDMSRLHKQLTMTGAHRAFVAVVSAGRECEEQARRMWEEGKPDEYFFLETYGSAVVEHLTALAANRLCAWADEQGLVALPHYSPGYSGWNIADQNRLHDAIVGKQRTAFPGPLTVLDSGMPKPKKSLIAVYGITRHVNRVADMTRLVPCEDCSMRSCAYRRAPYKFGIRNRPDPHSTSAPPLEGTGPLTLDAKYSLRVRTLRKWSEDWLRIEVLEDNSIEAFFRYDGTTCSNLGRPLSYDYHIKLSPASEGYLIQGVRCEPSSGDEGHKSMCAYLSAPETFFDIVSSERPLVGKRLDELLEWQPGISPSGCYCNRAGRNHKWRIVFEVLHFTLAQSLKKDAANVLANSEFQPAVNLI